MTMLETLGVSLLCAFSALILRESKSPIAPFVTLMGGVLILFSLLPHINTAVGFAASLAASLPAACGETVGKVLAVGFLCGAGADVCTELGAPSLAAKLTLAGKVEMFLLALPLLTELLSRAEALLT